MKRITMPRRVHAVATALLCVMALSGCHLDMWNQPRLAAHQSYAFFENNSAARLPVEGTVQYAGHRRPWVHPIYAELTGEKTVPLVTDTRFWTGTGANQDDAWNENTGNPFLPDNYFKVNLALLKRGQERYNANCSACHGLIGDGNGVVTQRGFPAPPSYHIDRLREVEDGYFFDVMTKGFGRMYSYAARVAPEDRWAITAYIRALQHSQYANAEDPELRARVDAAVAAQAAADHGHGDAQHGDAHAAPAAQHAPTTH